jgi:hypothetical protein
MRTIILPGSKKEVKIKETPKELPINRWTDFQKYLIQAAGIGSDMGAVNGHFSKLITLLGAGLVEDAAREVHNLQMNAFLMLNKIDINSIAFNCLVDEFDDKKIEDYSEKGLIDLSQRLGAAGLTRAMVDDVISEVKKKSIEA